jgi:hypothetical protein
MGARALAVGCVALAGCIDFSTLTRDYSPFCPDGALVCEGFEHGLGAWSSDSASDPACDVRESHAVAHSGSSSLWATVNPSAEVAGGSRRNVLSQDFAPVSGGALSLRAYAQLSGPLGDGAMIFGIGSVADAGTVQAVEVAYSADGGWTAGGRGASPAVTPAFGGWSCLVLSIDLSSQPPRVSLTADGATVVQFQDASAPTSYQTVWLGIPGTPANIPEERFTDDVALATQALACP